MKWLYGVRARLRLVSRGGAEERMDEEIRFHIEMEAEKNVRAGMDPLEARRQAVLAFGGVEGHREELRGGRTLAWIGGLSLDLRLAWRMMVKNRWLSLVSGLGIALAVAIGTLFFGVRGAFLGSTLPFDEGERVVALQVVDREHGGEERHILHELALWREELRSVEGVSAWRRANRNLLVPGGAAGPVGLAEMTASGFRVARVPALLGRTLVEEDESPGAPAVAVLGYDLWRSRFGGDPRVVGREIRLGNVPHTVVGVMPDGFAFPVDEEAWVALRPVAPSPAPREGPEIFAFGRLSPGATLESADAELATLGGRMAAAYPSTHARLRPRAVPYTEHSQSPALSIWFAGAQTLTLLLLVVICVNISVLVHARTSARAREIAVRSALGASRARIVGQLFAEALVLSLGAALAGIAVAGAILAWADRLSEEMGGMAFWMELRLSPAAVLYALLLACGSAVIVGVVPALKVTGPRLRAGLERSGSAGGMRLGPKWTMQIVAQVAVATAILPAATFSAWDMFRSGLARPEYATEEFLTAQLAMEEGEASDERTAHFEDRFAALTARLEADPAVAHVTFTKHSMLNTVPGTILVEDLPRGPDVPRLQSVRTNEVDLDLFDAFGVQVVEGRDFRPSDLAEGASPVIVSRAFVKEVLGGRNAVGRELRYTWRYGWRSEPVPGTETDTLRRYEIIGVVGDQFMAGTDPGEARARVFHPATAGRLGGVNLAIRLRDRAPEDFAPRLRELTAAVDPALRLHDVLPMEDELYREQRVYRFGGISIALVTLSVVLLSAAGIHALMSFTITRRRREIGIRAALGARPARLLMGIFSRAAGQVGVGLVLGIAAATLLNDMVENLTGGQAALFVSGAAALMTIVGLLAALEPARRGLRVEPMEALRAD